VETFNGAKPGRETPDTGINPYRGAATYLRSRSKRALGGLYIHWDVPRGFSGMLLVRRSISPNPMVGSVGNFAI